MFLPLRTAAFCVQSTSALAGASFRLAGSAASSLTTTALGAATEPARFFRGGGADAPSSGATGSNRPARSASAPGDGLLLAGTAAVVAANAAGFGLALIGRTLRVPGLPSSVEAAVAIVDFQPRLRRLLADRVGVAGAETVLGLANATAHTLAMAPASLAVDLALGVFKLGEARAEAQAWYRREPEMAQFVDVTGVHDVMDSAGRRVLRSAAPSERHAQRSAWIQGIGAAAVGALGRNLNLAGNAALVAAPKPSRATREAFSTTLGRGLATRHAVLPLQPDSLRRLDAVDVVIVDPRVLRGDRLRLARVRGAGESDLETWDRAQAMLTDSGLKPGWHLVPGERGGRRSTRTEALFEPAPHPLAAALVAETQRADIQVVSVDDPTSLGALRPAFDEIAPLTSDSIDDALAAALTSYQNDGHTVAVVSSSGAQALSSADVALGIWPRSDSETGAAVLRWADLIVEDLAGAWRVLHALSAAKAASQHGVAISVGASALGALLLIPTVRGRGPEPVTAGAALGVLLGYRSAQKVINAPVPRPAPIDEWHAMSVEQVRATLASHEVATTPSSVNDAEPHVVWQFVSAVREELADPLTPLMGLGAAASAILGSPVDAVLFSTVLTANAMLAAGQRLQAERRLNRLLAEQNPPAWKVAIAADGTRERIKVLAEQLQPGDMIEV